MLLCLPTMALKENFLCPYCTVKGRIRQQRVRTRYFFFSKVKEQKNKNR